MRQWRWLIVVMLGMAVLASSSFDAMAQANDSGAGRLAPGPRVALLIGNTNYEHESPLRSVANDISAMEKLLSTDLGFQVTTLKDLDYRALHSAAVAKLPKLL